MPPPLLSLDPTLLLSGTTDVWLCVVVTPGPEGDTAVADGTLGEFDVVGAAGLGVEDTGGATVDTEMIVVGGGGPGGRLGEINPVFTHDAVTIDSLEYDVYDSSPVVIKT